MGLKVRVYSFSMKADATLTPALMPQSLFVFTCAHGCAWYPEIAHRKVAVRLQLQDPPHSFLCVESSKDSPAGTRMPLSRCSCSSPGKE